jgi:rRNA maturation endonuclease Nob1
VCLLSKSRANCELFDEKRPHGEWKKVGGIFYRLKCSNCNFELKSPDDKNNFCPHCGADMKEGEASDKTPDNR